MKKAAGCIGAVVALAVLGFGCFVWTFCRVYVPAGYMAIVTAKTGKALPPGRILAEPGEKGVQRVPLAEGRHFLDPVNNDWRIVPVTTIPAGNVGIVTSKTGKELAPGEILAADDDSKGVWRRVLGPGTYRLNPEGYDVNVVSAINIPIGYAGVVTSLAGKPAPGGKFAGPGEKGILERILQPGLYYVNPRAYQVDVVEIGMNQVSIVGKSGTVVLTKAQSTSANGLAELQQSTLSAQSAKRASYMDANAGLGILKAEEAASSLSGASRSSQKGGGARRREPLGRERFAGKAGGAASAAGGKAMPAQVPPPAQASDSVAFGMNQFVQFPSSDGFAIMLDMTVEFELMPESISRIYMLYGDLPAVVSKIILPQILSVSRMKGSGYKAREFIDGEGRQKFQKEMTDELVKILGEKSILVRNAIVRHVEVPGDILQPIQETSIAKEQDLTNKTQQDTAKKQALLNAELAMVDQFRRETEQETEKVTATIAANMRKDVAGIAADAQLKVAEINLEATKIRAEIVRTKGEAEAKARFLVENEKALGMKRRAEVFKEPGTLADLQFVDSLSPDLSIRVIHAGEGTLWTDLKGSALALPSSAAPKAVKAPNAPAAGSPE
ncbi:MAG: hypothetical protein IKE55_11185 [Kiritimatiellae bacterium]|nr:hypothetical protein [Kiritimatiellia bacterium]